MQMHLKRPDALVALHPSLNQTDLAQVQRRDTALGQHCGLLENNRAPPLTAGWTKFPPQRYKQIRSQLILHNAILCHKTKSPTMTEEKLQVVVPRSKQLEFLRSAHEESGHQGMDRTMAKLSEVA